MKGDNNPIDDMLLYPPGQSFVAWKEVVGVVKGYLPQVGWATIALSEYAWLKGLGMAVLGALGLFT